MDQSLFQIYLHRIFTAKGREPLLVVALGGQAHADLSGGYRRFLEHDDVKDNERYRRDRGEVALVRPFRAPGLAGLG